ncbi:HAD-IA family hydrolase [Vibrio sp. OCN044]|uniref:HAD-IA family hydrolase n=1 Tax=Vibrio tetraodonis subsp. pristinus TaxID=2695891 RepID=A0A6L8LT79_9VIBR|nr:HAD family phosphatase [Vibrio tetraodonis]MYM59304.1 HAD-IA family hydrolase [Vibrio tetraodonis subsp. pristinus]
MKNKNINAVIFDFNGVIVDDSWLHERAWLDIFNQLSPNNHSIEFVKKTIHGRINKDIFEILFSRKVSGDELRYLSDRKEKIYRNLFDDNISLMQLDKAKINLFEYLKKNGLPFTIATASAFDNLMFFFERLSLHKWFDFDTVSYDDGLVKGKPNPDVYLKAAKNIDVNISECLVIEDAISGVISAKSAGVAYIIGFGNSFPSRKLINTGANIVIEDFQDFPYYLIEDE